MDNTTNTIIKIGCGILLGGILLAVSCVGATGALVVTGASVEKAAVEDRKSTLQLGEPRLRVTADRFAGKASWGVPVKNTSDRIAVVSVYIDLLDKDGLVVSQDIAFGETIPAGEEREVTGLRPLPLSEATQVAGIRATLT